MPTLLHLTGLGHPGRYLGAAFAAGLIGKARGLPGDRQVQVNAVQQRARQLVAVALDLFGTAAAAAGGVAKVTARAGVHRRHQLEACRKPYLVPRTGDHDLARLQRLAQHFKHAALELGQLIEKQHAMVGQGNLPGLRPAAAADQRRARGRVMGVAERALRPAIEWRVPGYRLDSRHL